MTEDGLKTIFHRTDLFEEVSCISHNVYAALDLDEEQMKMLDSFFGQALDEAFVSGVSHGMAEIILEDLYW